MSLNRFKYQIVKPGAPRAVLVGKHRHPFYDEAEIAAWQPNLQPQKGKR